MKNSYFSAELSRIGESLLATSQEKVLAFLVLLPVLAITLYLIWNVVARMGALAAKGKTRISAIQAGMEKLEELAGIQTTADQLL